MSYVQQQRDMLRRRQDAALKRQEMEMAKLEGREEARISATTSKETQRVYGQATRGGIRVIVVISLVILMFLHASVFRDNDRLFWWFVTAGNVMLIVWFVQRVHEDGPAAMSYMV